MSFPCFNLLAREFVLEENRQEKQNERHQDYRAMEDINPRENGALMTSLEEIYLRQEIKRILYGLSLIHILMEQTAKNYALEQSSFTTTGSITKVAAPDFTKETALTIINDCEKTYTVTLPCLLYTSFTMPVGKVEVKVTFMDDNTMLNYFVDVKVGDYFYDAVLWAAEKGITSGTDATHFSPNAACTRAQIVTFLWRAAGSPEPKNMSSFTDVPADSYYAKAVAWAVKNGITGGTGDGKFSPDAPCTRAQMATVLWRANGSPKVTGTTPFSDAVSYTHLH